MAHQHAATKPRKRWHQRWAARIPLAFVALMALAALTGYHPEEAPAQPTSVAAAAEPAPEVAVPVAEVLVAALVEAPPQVGSAEWLLADLRDQDPGFATTSDDTLIQLADNMCAYREAHGPSGSELTRIAQQSGFTAHQAEVLSTSTYVYCTAQTTR
jgi:hypothetical protein